MIRWLPYITWFYLLIIIVSTSYEYFSFADRYFQLYFFFYFFVYIFLFAINHFLLLRNKSWHWLNIKKLFYFNKNQLTLPIVTLLFLIGGLTHSGLLMQKRGVWADEIASMQNALNSDQAAAVSAASYHQPPLDQQFLLLSGSLLGYSELSIRSHTLFALLLFLLLFPAIIFQMTNSVTITAFACVLYLFQPYLSYYSIEARPLQLAQLFLIFYIHLTWLFIEKKIDRDYFPFLFIVLSLFLLSINLQPITFAFWTLLNSFIFFRKTQRPMIAWGLIHFFATLIYIPVLIKTFARSQHLGQIPSTPIEKIEQYLSLFSLDNLNIYFYGYEPFLGVMAFIFLVTLVWSIEKKKWGETKEICFLLMIFITNALTLDVVNRALIEWPFYYRYIILLSLFLIFPFSLVLKKLSIVVPKRVFVAGLISTGVFYPFSNYIYEHRERDLLYLCCSFQPDFMDFLKRETNVDDKIIKINLVEYGQWREQNWSTRDIYMPLDQYPQLKDPIDLFGLEEWHYQIIPFEEFIDDGDKYIYVIESLNRTNNLSKLFMNFPRRREEHHFKNNVVFKFLLRSGYVVNDFKSIFEVLAENATEAYRGLPYEVLFYFAWKEKDLDKMKYYFEKIKQLQSKLKEAHHHYQFNARKQINIIVSKFESLINDISKQSQD